MESIVFDYSQDLQAIILNQQQQIELLESFNIASLELNAYFYILIFLLVGVGLIYLMYRFLKIFL